MPLDEREDPEPPPPLDVPPTNTDGSLRPYNTTEIAQMEIEHVGVGDGSHPTMARRVNESTISAEYFCAYDELEAFICHMVGYQKIYDKAGAYTLTRLLPQAYPDKLSTVATSIDEVTGHRYMGIQEADGRPIYDKWRVKIGFQHVPFLLMTDEEVGDSSESERYLQELPSTAAPEYISLPGGILKFQKEVGGAPSGTPIPYGVGFINTAVTVKKKWIRVPYSGWQKGSALRARVFGNIEAGTEPYLGTINKTVFLGYAPGQLLFTGVEEELMLDPVNEDQHWNLTYTWLAKSVSHNWFKFFDPAGVNTGWYFASNDGFYYDTAVLPDGTSLFNKRDHFDLFLFDLPPPPPPPPPAPPL